MRIPDFSSGAIGSVPCQSDIGLPCIGRFRHATQEAFVVADENGRMSAGTDRVGVMDQVSPPAKISFLIPAWTPQFPSTTWVMPKSTPIVIKEIASSSVSFLVVIRNLRILRNASRKARSTDDFE